jgi:adenosylhomocysteine nucleosidase
VVVAETGIGKVNAAMTTTLALMQFRPAAVIFTGIAGGVNPALNPGDLVIARSTAHHDYETVTFDRQPSRQTRNAVRGNPTRRFSRPTPCCCGTPRPPPPRYNWSRPCRAGPGRGSRRASWSPATSLSRRPPGWRNCAAGFNADATEMEGAAVAQVCYQQGVPCLVIRSLSDRADENARNDMLSFYKTAARNSAALVMAILEKLPQ